MVGLHTYEGDALGSDYEWTPRWALSREKKRRRKPRSGEKGAKPIQAVHFRLTDAPAGVENMRQLTDTRLKEVTPYNPQVVALAREQAPLPGLAKGCRDCNHRVGEFCGHPTVGGHKLNVFTGKAERTNLPKYTLLRMENGICGPEARLWETVTITSNYRTYAVGTIISLIATVGVSMTVDILGLLLMIPTLVFLSLWVAKSTEGDD